MPHFRERLLVPAVTVTNTRGICHGRNTHPHIVFMVGNLTADRYRNDILLPHVVPFVQPYRFTFKQDNARYHVARVNNHILAANNVDVFLWLAFRPDLSQIEHLWDNLDNKVRGRNPVPSNNSATSGGKGQHCLYCQHTDRLHDQACASKPSKLEFDIPAHTFAITVMTNFGTRPT